MPEPGGTHAVPAFSIGCVLFCGMFAFGDYFVFPGMGKQGMLALRWGGAVLGIYAAATRSVGVWTVALFMIRANMFTLWAAIGWAAMDRVWAGYTWLRDVHTKGWWRGRGKERRVEKGE
jgi:hypothetical protein